MKKQITWAWVSRNSNKVEPIVVLWSGHGKPSQAECEYDILGDRFAVMICVKEFKKVTGLVIEPGTCQKVQFNAKVMK